MNDFVGKRFAAFAIGASAGAIETLSVILPRLNVAAPFPVFVVVHLPARDRSVLVDIFAAKCAGKVQEVEDKTRIEAGTIYFAPPDYHAIVESAQRIGLCDDEPLNYCRPSVDVLFESAADVYGESLVGIVLTGANSDGARGLTRIARLGGTALVQDPETAFAPAMPKSALLACPAAQKLSVAAIGDFLNKASIEA